MKKISALLLVASVVFFVTNLLAKPQASITFHFVTDDGKSASHIPINASTFDHWQPGEGFGQDIDSIYTNTTDENGLVTFTISSPQGDIACGTGSGLTGYYPVGAKYQFKTNELGKWQPWNPTVDVIIKPIINPIPMYAQNINIDIPAKSTPVGFDLEAADWVAPYGKGTESDFIFTMTEKIPFGDYNQPYDLTWTLSFPNKGDGIQSVISLPLNQGSALRLPRFAPEGGYQPTLVQELALNGNKRLNGIDGENQNYFFRVRTVLDASGKVQSALYGKIAGPIQYWGNSDVHMIYYLNPTPNDRNMEFDPSKNLFQNLPSLQQVKAP